ncbi:hypothetical protein ACFJIY_14720 [Pimelobacter simplex]|uniref:hypothetical protein n=1 Tax=Nocardioides simplex TaxID=2045 RepID=UPI003672E08D
MTQPVRSAWRRRATAVAALVLLVTALISAGPAAHATTYGTYGTATATPDVNGTKNNEGFAAGARYLYSVKVGKKNKTAVIYRWDTKKKKRVLMTNRANGTTVIEGLGHANGMALVPIKGKQYLFVVTMTTKGKQVIKLLLNGASYQRVGAFKLRTGSGAYVQATGISLVAVTASEVRFFFAQGDAILRGAVALDKNKGKIEVTSRFTAFHESPQGVNTPQSIFYDPTHGNLYVPSTKHKGNVSAVFVYKNVTWETEVHPPVAADPTFLVASQKFTLFEIEGLGISGGRLYFSTNRSNDRSKNRDGIHWFKTYTP